MDTTAGAFSDQGIISWCALSREGHTSKRKSFLQVEGEKMKLIVAKVFREFEFSSSSAAGLTHFCSYDGVWGLKVMLRAK